MSTAGHHHYAGPADHHSLNTIHTLLDTAWHHAPHLGASERARFTLIVAELVANVIEHGTRRHTTPPHLDLTVTIHGGAIRGTLTDNGAELPPPALNAPRPNSPTPTPGHPPADDDLTALRESGRGLHLVRTVADDLTLTRTDGHNHWQFAVHARHTTTAT